MSRVDDAREILVSLGLPKQQTNERSALTLLALAGIGPRTQWKKATQNLLRIWDIMQFMRDKYGKNYAANTRETIRRQTIHQFEQARIVDRNPDDPARPTNSGKTAYALSEEAVHVVRLYGSRRFDAAISDFVAKFGSLQAAYRGNRARHRVPLKMPDGSTVYLSPGKHNRLQVEIIEQFGPRYAPGAEVLYVGDTESKHVVCDTEKLAALRVPLTRHDKLPDIILYSETRDWLFLIEAVTSHGPVDPKRHREIEKVLKTCSTERVYVTAFLDLATFRKYAGEIAWETEVWVAEHPEHMIHFNGPKFLGPYEKASG